MIVNRLQKHLEKISSENAKVLIFVGTKRVADDLTRFLRQDGWPALAIHGDKQQNERDWVLSEFKAGRSPIMIATDVASRGLGMCFLLRSAVYVARVQGLLLSALFFSCRLRLLVCFCADLAQTSRAALLAGSTRPHARCPLSYSLSLALRCVIAAVRLWTFALDLLNVSRVLGAGFVVRVRELCGVAEGSSQGLLLLSRAVVTFVWAGM